MSRAVNKREWTVSAVFLKGWVPPVPTFKCATVYHISSYIEVYCNNSQNLHLMILSVIHGSVSSSIWHNRNQIQPSTELVKHPHFTTVWADWKQNTAA